MNRTPTDYDRRYWNKLCVVLLALGLATLVAGGIAHILFVKLCGWVFLTLGLFFGEKARDNEGWWFLVPAVAILLAILIK